MKINWAKFYQFVVLLGNLHTLRTVVKECNVLYSILTLQHQCVFHFFPTFPVYKW